MNEEKKDEARVDMVVRSGQLARYFTKAIEYEHVAVIAALQQIENGVLDSLFHTISVEREARKTERKQRVLNSITENAREIQLTAEDIREALEAASRTD